MGASINGVGFCGKNSARNGAVSLKPRALSKAYICCYYYACHPTMCSMSLNVDNSKHSRKKKTTETKETYAQSLTTTYVYFPLCFIYNTPFVVLAPSSVSRCALYVLFLNPKPHPSSIPTPSVWVCHPHPLLLLASWRPLSWSLKRDTILEMATCVATETI